MPLKGQILKRKPLADRLWAKVDVRGPDDCWEWQGSKVGEYGHIGVGGRENKLVLTHRAAYEVSVGPIPDGMKVCHTCDNPPCCNPKHLFLGTQADNVRDRDAKGRTARGDNNGRSKKWRALESRC